MPMYRRLALATAALTLGALTTGCDTVADFTPQQATDRVSTRAQEAFQQLPAGATLKVDANRPAVPCGTDPNGPSFVEIDYSLQYPTGWPVEQTMETLAGYWQKAGYKTVNDERGVKGTPSFSAEDQDGFRIGVSVTYRDDGTIDAYLISSSPCS